MFEKEAEEYAKQNNPAEYGVRATHFTVLNSFKDGAEFGYNKANEWHYVKDGDYPKEKGNYLVAWKRTHHVEEFGEWGFDVDLFNADEGYFEGVGDYVIAWKEIEQICKLTNYPEKTKIEGSVSAYTYEC